MKSELKYTREVVEKTQELVKTGASDKIILQVLTAEFDPGQKEAKQLQEGINLERMEANNRLERELKKGEWKFLDLRIHHSGNSDGYVLMYPQLSYNSATEGWKCHLGNYSALEDAQEAALFYFMLARPGDFHHHLHRKACYDSGTHLAYVILIDALKRDKIVLPKEITREDSPNGGIVINGKKF